MDRSSSKEGLIIANYLPLRGTGSLEKQVGSGYFGQVTFGVAAFLQPEMPRPGPRPYECVRRAWHSERHQPIRGSIIQEIFKVVNEIHSAATKKNKEWQEKLPIVVFKAEEIMYSKANSEAEYADVKTLWERLNDAINTIIRRDESTESGDFLQPCIEAALNLGCTPRRTTRSQRNNNPRCYLSPNTQEATESTLSPKIPKNSMVYEGPACLRPLQSRNPVPNTSQYTPNCLNQATPINVNPARMGADSGSSVLQDKPILRQQLSSLPMSCSEVPLVSENYAFPQHRKQSFSLEAHPSPNSGHMYPLYYFNNQQTVKPEFTFPGAQDWNRKAFTVGMPAAQPVVDPQKGLVWNLPSHSNSQEALKIKTGMSSHFGGTSKNPSEIGYDLSLRLGPSPAPCLSMESNKNLEDLGSDSSHDRSRYCDPSPSNTRNNQFDCVSLPARGDKEFSFFPPAASNDSLEPSTRWSPRGEGLQFESPTRKRKATIGSSAGDGQLHWQQSKPSANPFFRTEQSS